jgi:plasmid stability protein
MSTMIQIRNVPDPLHRAAKARAALDGLSLSDFAQKALAAAVSQPSTAELAARIRLLPPVRLDTPAADIIRADRDSR